MYMLMLNIDIKAPVHDSVFIPQFSKLVGLLLKKKYLQLSKRAALYCFFRSAWQLISSKIIKVILD